MKKVLFFGGSGLLALNWAKRISADYKVYLIMHKRRVKLNGVTIVSFEKDFESSFIRYTENLQPDFIINCAALTNVEFCEENPVEAEEVNSVWAKKLAQLSKRLKAKMVHISTDHLYDGQNLMYHEEDPITPLNQYAKTKANAEKEVMSANKEALIIRTNFFGWGLSYRRSFSDFIIDSLRDKKNIHLFNDVIYTPIYINELVKQVHELIGLNSTGIYNVVGSDTISKYDFGIAIADVFNLPKHLINQCSIKAKPQLTLRPKNMCLSNSKLQQKTQIPVSSLKQQLLKLKIDESQKVQV